MHHVRMMKDLNPKARLPFHPLPTYYSRRLEGGGGGSKGGSLRPEIMAQKTGNKLLAPLPPSIQLLRSWTDGGGGGM